MSTRKGKYATITMPDPEKVSRETLRLVMPEAVSIVTRAARELTPVGRTHTLVNSISGRVEKEGEMGIVAAQARHAHLVHEGTQAHPVTLDKRHQKKALFIPGAGHVYLRRSAQHPGTQPNRFLFDAFKTSERDVNALFQRKGELWLRRVLQAKVGA